MPDVKELLEILKSPTAAQGFRKILAHAMQGKSMDEVVGILSLLERATPGLAKMVQQVARALLEMPVGKLVMLIGSPAAAADEPAGPTPVVAAPKQKLKTSTDRKAFLKVQGRYIGLMRLLAPAAKAKIKKLARSKGMPAAIAEMERVRAGNKKALNKLRPSKAKKR